MQMCECIRMVQIEKGIEMDCIRTISMHLQIGLAIDIRVAIGIRIAHVKSNNMAY